MIIKLDLPLSSEELASLFDQKPIIDRKIEYIVTSSKEARYNSLFIALSGKSTDGDVYIDEAKANGALTLSAKRADADIYIDSAERALLKIANHYKSKLTSLKYTVAITGSVGKTTTKNILERMLSSKYKTHATFGNYNNFLGCAHTILTAPKNTEILIIEAGMNHKGELADISKAIAPDISIITNIGNAHVGNFSSKEEIAKAKMEILTGMRYGKTIIPYGEPLLSEINGAITYSITDSNADCYLKPLDIGADGSSFDLHTPHSSLYGLKITLAGEHILNSIAACAAVLDSIMPGTEEIKQGINNTDGAETRGRFIMINGLTIFDDSYSSSPEAVKAVLKRLSLISGIKSAVLGDMLELGESSEALHEEIGRELFKYGFSRLFAFGKYADSICRGAINAGMKKENVFLNYDLNHPEFTANQIIKNCTEGELILVKASHEVKAERIIKSIENQ